MLILASGSPRRRDLLDLLRVAYRVDPAEIDETPIPNEIPAETIRRLAIAKGASVADRHPGEWVLSADTVVTFQGETFNKPADAGEATGMLYRLSGTVHEVHTGVALGEAGASWNFHHAVTAVRFRSLSAPEIEEYVATGEPFGKAGAYAVQGLGGTLVEHVEGELSTVIGLPLRATARMLSAAGISHALDP
jgi:septum formation protein